VLDWLTTLNFSVYVKLFYRNVPYHGMPMRFHLFCERVTCDKLSYDDCVITVSVVTLVKPVNHLLSNAHCSQSAVNVNINVESRKYKV